MAIGILPALTATADTLAAHPHLLDGALGRALAYMALALLTGQRLWLSLAGPDVFSRIRPLQIAAVLIGFTGVLLVFNGMFFQEANPFASDETAGIDFNSSFTLIYQILWHTRFGKLWLLYSALLLAGALCIRHSWLAWAACMGMTTALAAASHAGEDGWLAWPLLSWPFFSWSFLVDFLHLAFAMLWLGGMLLLAAARLGGLWQTDVAALQRFSRIALPLFIVTLALGTTRLWVQYWVEQGLGTFYLLMLALKLVALSAVTASAWSLRRQLANSGTSRTSLDIRFDNSSDNNNFQLNGQPFDQSINNRLFDDRLSLELFFAAVLLLCAALLTQLPPR